MEMEAIRPAVKKKLWNMLRAIAFTMKKGLIKTKISIPFDLHLMLKRTKIAGKAIANLVEFHHGSAFSCQTIDIANSYISTRDYEFSCCSSNSPNADHPFRFYFNKLQKRRCYFPKSYRYDDFSTLTAVLDIVHVDQKSEAASPLVPLPGFGKSPLVVRQLRVTDSPFSLKDDDDGDSQIVDRAAEEFIVKFYKDLRLERSLAAFESPYRNTLCR